MANRLGTTRWREGNWDTPAILGALALLFLATIGYFRADDYGIGWDEIAQRRIGIQNLHAIQGEQMDPLFKDVDYGPLLEVGLEELTHWMGYKTRHDIYPFRHFAGHLLYLAGLAAFYALLREHYGSGWFALVGAALLLLTPRFYAHSFFNSKDIPFLCANIFTLYLLHRMLERPHLLRACLLGLVIGWTINLRIVGVSLLVLGLALILFNLFRTREHRLTNAAALLMIPILALLLNYLTWPMLWDHPFTGFQQIWSNMSQFRWNGLVLYRGEVLLASDLPWYYLLDWISITTPIPILLLCGLGLLWLPYHAIPHFKGWKTDLKLFHWALWWAGGVIPITIVIVRHSIVYDDWRHLYFCYVYFLLVGLVALHSAIEYARKKWPKDIQMLAAGLACAALTPTAWFIVTSFPVQQVYFNGLVPHRDQYLLHNFERDYWGISYKAGLEYIAEHDDRSEVWVAYSHQPGNINHRALEEALGERLRATKDLNKADYYLDIYRPLMRRRPEQLTIVEEYYSIVVQDSPVLTVYRLR